MHKTKLIFNIFSLVLYIQAVDHVDGHVQWVVQVGAHQLEGLMEGVEYVGEDRKNS
jgi:hypothetical protein